MRGLGSCLRGNDGEEDLQVGRALPSAAAPGRDNHCEEDDHQQPFNSERAFGDEADQGGSAIIPK